MIAIFVSPIIVNPREMAAAIVKAARGAGKTIVSCFMGKEGSEGTAELRAGGIPVYRFPEEAAFALGAMNRYRFLRDRPVGSIPSFAIDRPALKGALAASRRDGWLPGAAVETLLLAAGLPVAPSRVVPTAAAAI